MVHGLWSIVLDELFWATCGKWQRRLAAERTEPRRLCHYAFPQTLSRTLSQALSKTGEVSREDACLCRNGKQAKSRRNKGVAEDLPVWIEDEDEEDERVSGPACA